LLAFAFAQPAALVHVKRFAVAWLFSSKWDHVSCLHLAHQQRALREHATLFSGRSDIAFGDWHAVKQHIDKAKKLCDEGGDWERKNRLKVYEALFLMVTRDFKKAGELFLDSTATFGAYVPALHLCLALLLTYSSLMFATSCLYTGGCIYTTFFSLLQGGICNFVAMRSSRCCQS